MVASVIRGHSREALKATVAGVTALVRLRATRVLGRVVAPKVLASNRPSQEVLPQVSVRAVNVLRGRLGTTVVLAAPEAERAARVALWSRGFGRYSASTVLHRTAAGSALRSGSAAP